MSIKIKRSQSVRAEESGRKIVPLLMILHADQARWLPIAADPWTTSMRACPDHTPSQAKPIAADHAALRLAVVTTVCRRFGPGTDRSTVSTLSTLPTLSTLSTLTTLSTLSTLTTLSTLSTVSTLSTLSTLPTLSTLGTLPTLSTVSTLSTLSTP